MAIFVMATGVLAVAALYPLGLRESVQSQSDFKQVMFADYVLNIAVTAACSPNVTWSDWKNWANTWNMAGKNELTGMNDHGSVPNFILAPSVGRGLETAIKEYNSFQDKVERSSPHILDQTYAVYCVLVPGFSDQIMGIMVRSLDGDTRNMSEAERKRRLEIQPLYYTEARFQGKMN